MLSMSFCRSIVCGLCSSTKLRSQYVNLIPQMHTKVCNAPSVIWPFSHQQHFSWWAGRICLILATSHKQHPFPHQLSVLNFIPQFLLLTRIPMLRKENVGNNWCNLSNTACPRCSVSAINTVVLRTPVGLPAVPAGRVADASCSSGCRVMGTAQQAADRLLHDPVLQPAQPCKRATYAGTSSVIMSQLNGCVTAGNAVPYAKGMRRHRHRASDLLCDAGGLSPHSGDRSKLIDGAAWHHLVSEETRRHRSRGETCTQRDDHCDFRSATRKTTLVNVPFRYSSLRCGAFGLKTANSPELCIQPSLSN